MHREESEQLTACADCGAEVSVGVDRAFAFGSSGVLCWDCAERRGGSYDGQREVWSVAPRTDDLAAEGFEEM